MGPFGTRVAIGKLRRASREFREPEPQNVISEKKLVGGCAVQKLVDGYAAQVGHPGRNQTADARLVRAALWSLSYRANVW